MSLEPDPKRRASAETLLKHPYLNQAQMPMASGGVGARYQPQSFTRGTPNAPQECMSSVYSSLRSFAHSSTRYWSGIGSAVTEEVVESSPVSLTYNEQSETANYSSSIASGQSSESCEEICKVCPVDLPPKDCSLSESIAHHVSLPLDPKSKCVSCHQYFASKRCAQKFLSQSDTSLPSPKSSLKLKL